MNVDILAEGEEGIAAELTIILLVEELEEVAKIGDAAPFVDGIL